MAEQQKWAMAGGRPKVTVFGAGMIGIWIGGLLADRADVTLIGRAAMLDPLADGLRLTDVDGLDRTIAGERLRCTADAAALADADLILVTTKCMATPAAAEAIAAHGRKDAIILSFQNGIGNAGLLAAALPGRTILAGMVPYNIAQRGAAHFHRGTGGSLVVAAAAALEDLAPLFAGSGAALLQSADIAGVQWGKLLVNLNNAINALSGVSLMEQLRQRDFRRAWALGLAEGLKLAKAAGIAPVDPLPVPLDLLPQILRLPDGLYRFVMTGAGSGRIRVDPHARSSMADDLARGRPTEVDYLQGAVVDLADALGRRAPVNARVVALVRAAEGGASPWQANALYRTLRQAAQDSGSRSR